VVVANDDKPDGQESLLILDAGKRAMSYHLFNPGRMS
jgi:hypothetical protein